MSDKYIGAGFSKDDWKTNQLIDDLSGVSNAAMARTNLGLSIGTDVQAHSALLDDAIANNVIGRKNFIINGNFDIWQRGTSFTATEYTADRWGMRLGGSSTTLTRQAFTLGQTDVPNEPTYYLRANITSAGSLQIYQKIESVRTFAGQAVTISFYAKAGASVNLAATSLRQNFGTGGSPSTPVIINFPSSDVPLTTTWQRFELTVTVPSISGKTLGSDDNDYLELIFQAPTGSAVAIDIAQVQLEKGSVATDFEYRPIGEELALCKRYYQTINNRPLQFNAEATTQLRIAFLLPYHMRGTPTVSMLISNPSVRTGGSGFTATGSTFTGTDPSPKFITGSINGFSGLTAGSHYVGNASVDLFGLDAEL